MFGWIDSTLRNIDGVLIQRFSPKFLRVVATGQAIYDKTRKMPRFLSHQHGLLAGPKPSLAYATRCAQGRQDRRRHRCDNLHNPLKSLFLSHTLLILMVSKLMGESRSPRPPFYL